MQDLIITSTIHAPANKAISACIGYFDGFHLGHQALFNRTLSLAKESNTLSGIISFSPDPLVILNPSAKIEHLTSLQDRRDLAEKYGFDLWITIEFSQSMAQMEPDKFIDLLKKVNIQNLVCGFDFSFGDKGKGKTKDLLNAQDPHFNVEVVDEIDYEGSKISTSRIKEAISLGHVHEAERLLGRTYGLKGIVVRGRQIGRTIGYPTANLSVESEYLIPQIGVYSGFVIIDNLQYSAMIGVGYNPTVTDDHVVSIEAHIFDYNHDIYDKEVTFLFKHYIRGEIKFDSLDGLIKQLKLDESQCRETNSEDLV